MIYIIIVTNRGPILIFYCCRCVAINEGAHNIVGA